MTIPTHLIERALNLTGKTYDNLMEYHMSGPEFGWYQFCFYLLSPEFIEKYRRPSTYEEGAPEFEWRMQVEEFGGAIYEYQSGNPGDLISLLEKIPGQQTK